jgi:acyl phosphate:glycerol-3-phosphate acyltransferase
MSTALIFLSAAAGYLIGSISFSRVFSKILSPDIDLKHFGYRDEKNNVFVERLPTATTVSMALGWKVGCIVSLMDILKILVPAVVFRWLYPDQYYFLLVAVFGIVGNNWPIYYRFKGGSGLSTIYGGLLAVDPLAVPVTVVAGFVIGMILLRSMILVFLLPLLLLIPWFWFRTHDIAYLFYSITLILLYTATLVPDILKYLKARGTAPISERAVMESMPMGRGMLKMMDKLNLQKK